MEIQCGSADVIVELCVQFWEPISEEAIAPAAAVKNTGILQDSVLVNLQYWKDQISMAAEGKEKYLYGNAYVIAVISHMRQRTH